jgi:hypothetical protein
MTVKFNENMVTPTNYTSFNNSVLGIKILPGEMSDYSELTFNWTVIGFKDDEMII